MIKPRFPGLSRGKAEEMAAKINPKPNRIFEREDVIALLLGLEPTGDELLEQRETLVEIRKALDLMERILSELPEQDRMLLERAHAEGVKFSRIARSLGIDQRSLYRRNEGLLKKLRTDLEKAGIRWEALSGVLGTDARPSETGPGERAGAGLARRRLLVGDEEPVDEHIEQRLEQQEKLVEKRKALVLMQRILSELPSRITCCSSAPRAWGPVGGPCISSKKGSSRS